MFILLPQMKREYFSVRIFIYLLCTEVSYFNVEKFSKICNSSLTTRPTLYIIIIKKNNQMKYMSLSYYAVL